jgi:hypothetical protein
MTELSAQIHVLVISGAYTQIMPYSQVSESARRPACALPKQAHFLNKAASALRRFH